MNSVDKIIIDVARRKKRAEDALRGAEWVASKYPDQVAVQRIKSRGGTRGPSAAQSIRETLRRVLSTGMAERATRAIETHASATQLAQLQYRADQLAALFVGCRNDRDVDRMVTQILRPGGVYYAMSSSSGPTPIEALRQGQREPVRVVAPGGVPIQDVPEIAYDFEPQGPQRRSVEPQVEVDSASDSDEQDEKDPLDDVSALQELIPRIPSGLQSTARDAVTLYTEKMQTEALSRQREIDYTREYGLARQAEEAAQRELLEADLSGSKLARNGVWSRLQIPEDLKDNLRRAVHHRLALEADRSVAWDPEVEEKVYVDPGPVVQQTLREATRVARVKVLEADVQKALNIVNGLRFFAPGEDLAQVRARDMAQINKRYTDVMDRLIADPFGTVGQSPVDLAEVLVGTKTEAAKPPGLRPAGVTFEQASQAVNAAAASYKAVAAKWDQLLEELDGREPTTKKARDARDSLGRRVQRLLDKYNKAADVYRDLGGEFASDSEQEGQGMTSDPDYVRMLLAQRAAGNTSVHLARLADPALQRLVRAGRVRPEERVAVLAKLNLRK